MKIRPGRGGQRWRSQFLAVDGGGVAALSGHGEAVPLDRAHDCEPFFGELLGAAFRGDFVEAVADDGDVLVALDVHGDLLKLASTFWE